MFDMILIGLILLLVFSFFSEAAKIILLLLIMSLPAVPFIYLFLIAR